MSTDHFEEFQDHTLLKHAILDKYLKAWAIKLLTWGRAGDEVWFVDAFAGEGSDHQGNPGSPVIAARIAAGILAGRGRSLSGNAPMRVLAIERVPKRCDRLRDRMAEFLDQKLVEIRCSTLHELLDRFVAYTGNAPVLYFLDPFGVEGLIAEDLPSLFRGNHNEVFALFSDIGARRLHATLLTPDRNVDYEVAQVLSAPSLFPEITAEAAEAAREEAERSNRALRSTRAASERILQEALGPQASAELSKVPSEDRLFHATQQYMKQLQHAGAKYVISLPVRNESNQRVYQLVYASKSKQGLRTMKESMQAALNRSSLSQDARETINFEVTVSTELVIDQLRQHFKNQILRWTIDNDRGEVATIKRYLLEETPVFPAQFKDVKAALEKRGYRETAKPLTFRFPG